jgi:SAM-dependent methyltransferase
MSTHRESILDQFTRQVTPFAEAPAIADAGALSLLVEAAGTTSADTVLDVACGPGLVACAFAAKAGQVTGIDLTPAMIEHARELQHRKGLRNVSWQVGDVLPLPFADRGFSIVACRFAFHHFTEPAKVLAEMLRVCARGGRIVVTDVVASEDPEIAARFNRMDKLRDPSHVRFLPESELLGLLAKSGAPKPVISRYRLESDLDSLLGRSFPNPGDDVKIRRMFEESLADNNLGIDARRDGALIRYHYPVVILVSTPRN